MEVHFTLTKSDFWAFSRDTILLLPKLWVRVLAAILVVGAIWALLIVDILHRTDLFLPVLAGSSVLWGALNIWLISRLAIKRAQGSPSSFRPMTVKIAPDQLHLLQDTMDQHIAWQAVHRVVARARHIYIYRTFQTAWIIPKRAFARPSEADEFFRVLSSYYKEGKASSLPLSIAGDEETQGASPSITFDFTLEDTLQYEKVFLARATKVSTGKVYGGGIYMVAMGVILFALWYGRTGGSELNPSAFIGLICVVWGVVVFFSRSSWLTRRRVRALVASTPGLTGPRTVSIDPTWFHERTSVIDLKMGWKALVDVTEEGDYIYIFSTRIRAHPIPKRAFASPYDAQAFFHAARGYLQQAKSGALATAPMEGVWPPAPTARP